MRSAVARFALALAVVGALGAGAARVPELLARAEIFRLDGVRLEGARFLTLEHVLRTVEPPPGASVWDDPDPWVRPLRQHPLVVDVDVSRRFPDSLVLHVTEVEPVAFVAGPTLEPVDADGRRLPIDPSRHRLDLPLLGASETGADGAGGQDGADGADGAGARSVRALARELQRLEEADPDFVGMLSELSWDDPGEAVALWGDPHVEIRFRPPLPADRLRQALVVIGDVAVRYPDRQLRAVDLRFAQQVVVRF